MPAIYEDSNGTIHYYVPPPPPPPPPPTGTHASGFQHAVTVAQQATTAYSSGHASKTTVMNDWTDVEAIIANQYRIAWTSSSDPKVVKAAVAALDRQYADYFQNKGTASTIYNDVVASAKGTVQGETKDQRNAQIQYYNAYNEPASSKTKTTDEEAAVFAVEQANMNAVLQSKYGNGNDGVYTVDQIKAAAAALDQQDPTAAPIVDFLKTNMEGGRTLNDVLAVLQTQGLKLTPAEIKSGSLGTIKLTPAEIKSGMLALTPAEAQLAKIDPVTLAFLKAAGVPVTMSPQMAQLAKESPSLFAYMELNGVNISVDTPKGVCLVPTPGHTLYNLSDGSVLNITVGGKPYNASPAQVVGLYEGGNVTSKGSGIVDLATMLVKNLPVNPMTVGSPTSVKLANITSLMTYADGARSQYAETQLTTLLAAAPPATSIGATGYIAGTVNPFLTTQLNGFFTPAGRESFWNASSAIPALKGYLQTGIAAQFQPGSKTQLNAAGVYLGKVLSGASPEEAKMLIDLLEGQVNGVSPSKGGLPPLPDTTLLNALGQAVQLADQLPGTGPNEATQVAKWLLNTTERGVPVVGRWVADDFYYDITSTGNTDLPDALVNAWSSSGKYVYGTNGSTPIDLGPVIDWTNKAEGDYSSALQKQLGNVDYNAFENNKAETLKAFYAEYAHSPGIGVKVNVYEPNTTTLTPALTKAVTNAVTGAYSNDPNVTPQQIKQITTTDLAWIKSQSAPGATVTILPFIFAAQSIGTQTGLFFDISNPDNASNKNHPSQVLIDGSAAQVALQMDPNAYLHPQNVDVKWHYSSYRDFQLSNDLYQGGTIYTLPGNPLGIGSNGAASSATDFHKEFTGIMQDVAGGAAIVGGIALIPFTDGGSLALTAAGLSLTGLSLGWGTYEAFSQYHDVTSHGEQYTWSNPNTRWDIVGDATLAANWATLGVAGAAGGFARAADGFGQMADTLTSFSDYRSAMAAFPGGDAEAVTAAVTEGDVIPAGDVIPEGDAAPAAVAGSGAGNGVPLTLGDPAMIPALRTLQAVNSRIATGLNWGKTGLEVAGYGLGAVQTGVQTYSLVANWDKMSWSQRIQAIANIGMSTLPFFMEPIVRGIGEVANRNGRTDTQTPAAVQRDSWRLLLSLAAAARGRDGEQGGSADTGLPGTPPGDPSVATAAASAGGPPPPIDPAAPAGDPSNDPFGHIPQGNIQAVIRAILNYGDPNGTVFGRQAEPLTGPQISRINDLNAQLTGRGYAPDVVAAIEQALAAQPSEQRNIALTALESIPDDHHAVIVDQIPEHPTNAQAWASASMVVSLAHLPAPELLDALGISEQLASKGGQLNGPSPFTNPETIAWVTSDVASLLPDQRAQFGDRVDALDPAQLAAISGHVQSYGGQVQARLLDSLIWMQDPQRSTAGNIVYTLGQVESGDQVNARWNPAATWLSRDPSHDQYVEIPESLRTLLDIFNQADMPDVLRNYAPDAADYSPLSLALSPIVSRAVQAMHAPNGAREAADAVVRAIRQRATEVMNGDGSWDQPVKLRFLIGTGFNVGPRLGPDGEPLPGPQPLPETDGPPGAGLLGRDLLQLNNGGVPIQFRGSDGNVVVRTVPLDVEVHYVVDGANDPVQGEVNASLGFDAPIHVFSAPNADAADAAAASLLNDLNPDVVFFTEHPGRNSAGIRANMRSISVDNVNAPIDAVLAAADERKILTIAVGDGGNEAGMGDVNVHMPRFVLKVPDYISGTRPESDIFSIMGVRSPVTASVSNWGAQGFGGAVLLALGRLDSMHGPADVRTAIEASGRAGAVDGVLREPPGTPGTTAGVDGLSIEAHVGHWYILRSALGQPANRPIDLILFDSSSGGLIAASTIARYIREQTGYPVRRVVFTDHGNAPYGGGGWTQQEVAQNTNNALRTAEDFADKAIPTVLIGMVCNTACTSGEANYAAGITLRVSDLIKVTSEAMINPLNGGGDHPVVLATNRTVGDHAYRDTIAGLPGGGRLTVTEIAGRNWADLVNDRLPLSSKPVADAISSVVNDIVQQAPDATSVWLNCTHYPVFADLIAAELRSRGLNIPVIDPMEFQAQRLIDMMRASGSLNEPPVQRPGPEYTPPPVVVTTHDTPQVVVDQARDFMGRPDVRVFKLQSFGPEDPSAITDPPELTIDDIVRAYGGTGVTNWRKAVNVWEAVRNLQLNQTDAEQRAVYDALLRRAVPPSGEGGPAVGTPPGPGAPSVAPGEGGPPGGSTPPAALTATSAAPDGGGPADISTVARLLSRVRGSPLTWYGGMLAVTVPLSAVVDPAYLAIGNAVGFMARGLATAAPLVFPKISTRVTGVWNWATLALNGAYHDFTIASFNPAHWNWRSQPHNAGYALTDEIGGAQRAAEAVNGGQYKPAKLTQYGSQVIATVANSFLMANYSIPAGPEAWVPSVGFLGGVAYLLGKSAVKDAAAAVARSPAPQRVRDWALNVGQAARAADNYDKIPGWAIALGLAGFGASYLFQSALPKLNANAAPPTPPLRVTHGAFAYTNPMAVGTPAGLFRQNTVVTPTGKTETDVGGNSWIEVTGVAVGGKRLTAWVKATDVSVSEPTAPSSLTHKPLVLA